VVYADRIRDESGGSKLATTAARWFSARDPLNIRGDVPGKLDD